MTDHNKLEEKWDVQLRKGTLELVILAALKDRKLYGLELLQLLHRFETIRITEGTLYPLLDRLKRAGLVNASWQQDGDSKPRKYYELIPDGETKLTALSTRWKKSVEDIQCLLNNPGPEMNFKRKSK